MNRGLLYFHSFGQVLYPGCSHHHSDCAIFSSTFLTTPPEETWWFPRRLAQRLGSVALSARTRWADDPGHGASPMPNFPTSAKARSPAAAKCNKYPLGSPVNNESIKRYRRNNTNVITNCGYTLTPGRTGCSGKLGHRHPSYGAPRSASNCPTPRTRDAAASPHHGCRPEGGGVCHRQGFVGRRAV